MKKFKFKVGCIREGGRKGFLGPHPKKNVVKYFQE